MKTEAVAPLHISADFLTVSTEAWGRLRVHFEREVGYVVQDKPYDLAGHTGESAAPKSRCAAC